MRYEYKQFYRRKLPHRHSPGSILFVTFRLADTIPKTVLRQWLAEKQLRSRKKIDGESDIEFHRRWFVQFEDILHRCETGPMWLADPRVAQIVADSFHYRDGRVYDLLAYSIMSNHAHSVFRPLLNDRSLIAVKNSNPLRFESDAPTLGAIMQSLKGYTAREANRLLDRTGVFWEEESYDHEVRNDDELGRVIRYVLNNPVKAGLVKHWWEWKWNYYKGAQSEKRTD